MTPDSGTPSITLRNASTADEPAIHRLTEQLAAFPIPPWRTPGEIARADHALLAEAVRAPGAVSLVLLAEDTDGRVVGVLFVSTRADYFTGRPHAHVNARALGLYERLGYRTETRHLWKAL